VKTNRVSTCGRFRFLAGAFVSLSLLSCGGDGDGEAQPNGMGGQSGTDTGGTSALASTSGATGGRGVGGGFSEVAGASGLGGVTGAGGASSSGGTAGGGGSKATGGSTASSGTTAPGGTKATGGATTGGGATPTGGTKTTGGATTGGGATATGGSKATGGATGTGGACSTDACPMVTGITYACKQRFALGINYAWHNFAGDFGGIPTWSQLGVSQSAATYSAEMAQMAANGVAVIRWGMVPDFRGAGVEFDASDNPTGLSVTATADIVKALELAEANDLYLVLTIFSFDNFRPDRVDAGIRIRGMSPMVTNATRRAALVNNIVRPAARAVAGSPNAHRLLGWDVINEPEWAITATGSAPGGQDFDPNSELTAVSLSDMKALINESIAALREETPNALTSVGWAAAKWSWAFEDVNVHFHQPHIYGWVNQYWPYTLTPAALGYTGKPVVMGEFYLMQMPFETSDTFSQILTSWWNNGYAGAWPWQFNEQQGNLGLIKAFADAQGCSAGF